MDLVEIAPIHKSYCHNQCHHCQYLVPNRHHIAAERKTQIVLIVVTRYYLIS